MVCVRRTLWVRRTSVEANKHFGALYETRECHQWSIDTSELGMPTRLQLQILSSLFFFFFLWVITSFFSFCLFLRYILLDTLSIWGTDFLYFDWLFCIYFPKVIKPVFLLRYFIKKNVYKNLFNLKWRCGFTFFRFLEGKNSNLFHENVAFFFPFSV